MKRRLMCLLITMAIVFTMVGQMTIRVEAVAAGNMTEAEAWNAGIDVYTAWYNYRTCYSGVKANPIEQIYRDKESAFNRLFAQIYPNGPENSDVLEKAEKWLENFYNGVDEFKTVDRELKMAFLLSCVLYSGETNDSNENDVSFIDKLCEENTVDSLDGLVSNANNILNSDWMDMLKENALKVKPVKGVPMSQIKSDWYADFKDGFDPGKFSDGIISSILFGAKDVVVDHKVAIATAAQYDCIKSATAKDIDILREFENDGIVGEYIKAYTTGYADLMSKGESDFLNMLKNESNTKNLLNFFVDIGSSSISAGLGAAAAGSTGALHVLSVIGCGLALGFATFNIFESVWKFSGDFLFGQSAMKEGDLSLFYINHVRNMFYHGYNRAYNEFGLRPTKENAQKLNAYSRLMYRVFAASEMYASQINYTYAQSGLLNAEWMHYIVGGVDPSLTDLAKRQSSTNLQLRKNYLSYAYKSYADFCDESIYHITFNLGGGRFVIASELGFNDDKIVLNKIYSINETIPEGIPQRDGYNFLGWSTNPNSTVPDSNYAPGSTYSRDADLTLYAVWEKICSITYNPNGGKNAPAAEENKQGPSTLSSVEPTRTGYIFKGWARTPDATKAEFYKPNNMILADDGDVTLYAVWELGTFPVYFDANGGLFEDGSTSVMRTKTYSVPLTMDIPAPGQRSGYEFLGWSEDPKSTAPDEKFNAQEVASIGGNDLRTKYVYAVWCKNTAVVTYDYGIGRFDPFKATVKESLSKGAGQHLIGNPLAHYESGEDKLLNWYYYNGSEKVTCNIGDTVTINDDLYLYANWQSPKPLPTLSVDSDNTIYKPGETVKLSITIDQSDHFYIDTSAISGAVVEGTSALFVEETSPKAEGHRNYANGTTVTAYIDIPSDCPDGTYDVNVKASNSILANSEGTGSVDNETIVNASVRIKVQRNEIVEEKDMFTVSFDMNGGVAAAPEPLKGEEGSTVYLPDFDESSWGKGYEFVGWCSKASGKGTIYKGGKRYTISDNITLYAIWESVSGPLDVHIENDPKIYQAGDVAYISVAPDYADHFYFDISGNPGFTIKSKDGSIYTDGASFWNVDSEDYIDGETGFADNKSVMMYVYIPDDCRDGDYTFKVTATSARMDHVTQQAPPGSPMVEKHTTIRVRSTDDADSVELSRDHVTVHVGSIKRIRATIYPEIYNKTKAVYWSTDNRRIASIYDESDLWVEVEGKRVGSTYLRGEVDNAYAVCEIEVVECDYCNKEIDPDYLASSATCTEHAKYYYVCDCGNVSDETYEYGDLAEHDYTEWTVSNEPDEYTVGIKTRKCINCGKIESSEIPALGHTHDLYDRWFHNDTHHWHECRGEKCYEKLDMAEHIFADEDDLICDCGYEREPAHTHEFANDWSTDADYHWQECSCGEKNEIAAHTYNWTVEKEATEEEEGLERGTCSVCGYETTRAIPKKNHEHNYGEEWQKDEVNHWHECSCGEKSGNAAHTYNWTVEKEATEEEEGLERGTCSVCGYETTRAIPKKNHEHKYGEEWLNDEVNHWHECSCGEKNETAAHTYNWTVEKEATEDEEGLERGTCSVCGYETTRAIPKKNHEHKYGEEWQNDEVNHWHECSCGEMTTVEEHILKEVIDTMPTEETDGIAHDECEVCGFVTNEGKVIPALKHTHIMNKVEAKPATCSEEGNIEYYTCIKCHKNFSDKDGEIEIENVVTEKDPVNHIGETRVDGKIEPDCLNAGYTGDTVCVSCGVIIISGEVIPTNDNHNFEWKIDVEPTIEASGLKHEECSRCGAKRSENTEIPRIECEHSAMQHFDMVRSTCVIQGTCEYWYCSECNRKFFDEKGMLLVNSDDELLTPVDPKNHIRTELRNVKSATCSKEGYTGDTYCVDCSALVSGGTVIAVDSSAHSYINNVCQYCGKAEYYIPSFMFVDDEYHLAGGVLVHHVPDSLALHTDGIYEWRYCSYCNHEYGKVNVPENDETVELIVDDPVESNDEESITKTRTTDAFDTNSGIAVTMVYISIAAAIVALAVTGK